MTGKDLLTLLLVTYNFKTIEISTYRGEGNAQGYKIYAENKEQDIYFTEENCEGLLFNITNIINQMKKEKVEVTFNPFPGQEYSIKNILQMFNHDK